MRKRKKRRNRKTGFSVGLLVVCTAVVFLYTGWMTEQSKAAPLKRGSTAQETAETKLYAPDDEQNNEPANTTPTIYMSLDQIADDKTLWLVNKDNPIAEATPMLASAYPVIPLATADIELRTETLEAVRAWFDAAEQMGVTGLLVTDGYRSREEQEIIYTESADKSYAQPPDASEHQTGLAVDIGINEIPGTQMAESTAGRWLAETAWQYGLILRYPENKENITGISYEPWHFRYVGLPHAYYCYLNNLCWEEYLDGLKQEDYQFQLNGKLLRVYYTTDTDGVIKLPDSLDYTLSGDNQGGYVCCVTLE